MTTGPLKPSCDCDCHLIWTDGKPCATCLQDHDLTDAEWEEIVQDMETRGE